jgi:hypothetical protein
MMTSKNRLMVELNLTPEKFGKLLNAKQLADKIEYDEQETAILKSTAGKPFVPKAKADRPNQPTEPTEQKGIVTADTHGAARERIQSGSLATSNLVGQTIAAAQSLAKTQADAIEHFPQLVDQLTVMYLQERGLAEPGKPSSVPFEFEVKISAMDEFNALLETSGAAVHQLPEVS